MLSRSIYGGIQKAVVAGIFLTAATFALSAAAQEVVIGVRGGPESIDPHYAPTGTSVSAARNIFDTLVSRDNNLQTQAGLAVSWKPIDDLTWEFKLREGVTFHDGSPFTASDVKYSVERIPTITGISGGLAAYVKGIADTIVVDDLTVHFKTSSPEAGLPGDLARVFIVSQKATEGKVSNDFSNGDAAVGTGPFKFVSWEPRGALVLVRNDNYWGGEVPWAKVTFTEISNDSARVAALLSGDVDMINYAPPSSITRLQREDKIAISKGPSVYNFMIYPDQREPTKQVTDNDGKPIVPNPLRDLRVRKALSLGIDRKVMAERVMEGLAVPVNQLTPKGFFGSSPDLPDLEFNVEAAKALLAEAGFPDGFRVALTCTNDRLPNDGKVCAALGQMFARINITADVVAIPKAVYFPGQSAGDFSLMMNGWGSLTGEASYILSALAHTRDASKKLGVYNETAYSNAKADVIIEKALGTLDDETRRALLQEAMEIVVGDLSAIPIVNLSAVWATRSDRVTYEPRADEETRALNILPVK